MRKVLYVDCAFREIGLQPSLVQGLLKSWSIWPVSGATTGSDDSAAAISTYYYGCEGLQFVKKVLKSDPLAFYSLPAAQLVYHERVEANQTANLCFTKALKVLKILQSA